MHVLVLRIRGSEGLQEEAERSSIAKVVSVARKQALPRGLVAFSSPVCGILLLSTIAVAALMLTYHKDFINRMSETR